VRIVRADAEGAAEAADALRHGGVVVVPTDTVYGLAARPADAGAVQDVYRIKGRPGGKPLPVLAASDEQVRALGVAFNPAARALAARWWPGPLTLVFAFEDGAARPAWLEGRDEVAVRVPDHDFLRGLLETTGVLVATSANPHGAPTPRAAADVLRAFGARAEGGAVPHAEVDLVVDAGTLADVPSTLVNVAGSEPVVEREGAISCDDIADALTEAP
jgi:L-threonylcarbamoyladenylate synthase